MKRINLGAGRVFLKDANGNASEVGYLREISLDYSATEKEFQGSNTFPEDVALVNEKLTGKANHGGFDGALIATILGSAVTTGQKLQVTEAKTAAASITVDHAADFADDLGVLDANGKPMAKVASAPAVGQYAVNTATGTYTFAAGEAGTLSISYSYSSNTGSTASYSGRTVGASPKFEVHVYETARDGSAFGFKLYSVTFSKIGFGFKSQDFTESNIEFSCTRHPTTGKVFDQLYA